VFPIARGGVSNAPLAFDEIEVLSSPAQLLEKSLLFQLIENRVVDELFRLAIFEVGVLFGVEIDRVAYAVEIDAGR
jgi:hypothetical protein